jgi:hypothetical protein
MSPPWAIGRVIPFPGAPCGIAGPPARYLRLRKSILSGLEFLPGVVPLLEDVAEEGPQRDDTEAYDKDGGIQEQHPFSVPAFFS